MHHHNECGQSISRGRRLPQTRSHSGLEPAGDPRGEVRYCTQIVVFAGLLLVPTTNETGTAPEEASSGIRTFTWITPAVSPGAPPAYETIASRPAINTFTGSTGFGNGATAGFPSTPAGTVCPSPVP